MKIEGTQPPNNYRRLKPIIARLEKLTKGDDLVCLAIVIVSILGGAGDLPAVRQIASIAGQELQDRLGPVVEEEKRIVVVN